MSRSDRDELQHAKSIAGDVPILAALREWKRANELTAVHLIAAAEMWAARQGKTFKRIKVADAVDQFIAAKDRAKKQGERTYRSKLEPLKTFFSDAHIDAITEPQFSAYLEQWQDGVTRNDFRKRAVSLCRWAQKSGFIPRGLQLEIKNTERAEEEPTQIGTITPDIFRDALRFIHAKHPQHLAALVVAGFGAVRSDEIHGKHHDRSKRQTWEDIDLAQKHLNVTIAKRNTPAWRLVELSDAAIEWLKLCPGEHKGPICEVNAIAKIRALLIEAEFDLPENCFWHSAIIYRIAKTGDKAATATWAGNSVKEIDKRYRRPMTKAAGEAWFSIGPVKA
jgi:hypothetical protein